MKLIKKQKGYTLLEYCAGAAIILGIVVVGLNTFGNALNAYFNNLGGWVNGLQVPDQNGGNGNNNGGQD